MKNLYKLLSFLFIALITACSEDEPKPEPKTTDLEISVKDYNNNGAKANGVTVSLYKSATDWENEQNVVQTATTDANGVVLFKNLETIKYYVDAKRTNQSNWAESSAEIVTPVLQKDTKNTLNTEVAQNYLFNISSASGKSWRVTMIRENGVNVTNQYPTCFLNDVEKFYKSLKYELDEGASKCSSNDPQLRTGSYSFGTSGNNSTLRVTIGSITDTYVINSSTSTTMVLRQGTDELTLIAQ